MPKSKGRKPVPVQALATFDKWFPIAILLFGAAAYFNSLHAPFIFDDRFHILENARIREFWPPWPYLAHTSRPVVYLSLALNYALGGLDPTGYHVFNAAVHIAAALVLFGVIRRTLRLLPRFDVLPEWSAGLIALIWLVHPIQTESVTYTIQRGESLMGLFYLLTLYCAIRGNDSTRAPWWYAAAIASCCLGIGCKGVMLTAPVVVLLYDYVFLTRRRWGLYAALAATALIYPLLLSQAPVEWKESAGFEYAGAAPLQYGITQAAVVVHYLRQAFWPSGLCLDYGWPSARNIGEVFPQLVIIVTLLAGAVWAWRRKPPLGFVAAWFFVILIPTSSFIPIADLAAEHRMYLSLAALVVLAVAGLFMLARRLAIPAVAWLGGGAIVLTLTGLTIRRNIDYASEIAIWQDTVDKSPGNPRAQYDLGHALEAADRPQEAIAHYEKALAEKPDYLDALNNLGHVLSVSGRAQEAIPHLQRAIEINPGLAEAHFNLGYALAQQGRIKDAIAHLEEAVRIRPDFADAHQNLGIALAMDGRIDEAIVQWERALDLEPDSAATHNNLAYALSQKGRMREALAHYESAVRLKPDYAQALDSLAKLLGTLVPADGGDPNRAIELASRACSLTGNREAGYLETLAVSYAAAHRHDEANKAARQAIDAARAAGRPDLAREIESRMDRFR